MKKNKTVEKKIFAIVRYYGNKGQSHTYLYNDEYKFYDGLFRLKALYPSSTFKVFTRWCRYAPNDFYE